ncbi:MAG: curli production assembly protein CsgG [Acidobacteria bacterium]|nr:curli production assembly protein CsgG [Acidobacteriota bacterium]MBI3427723.1 curli production assembly protein CsgG [Acidobacteriota bacterium]
MSNTIITRFITALALLTLLAVNPANNSSAQEKRRIAVLDFDYATVTSNVYAYFGSNQDVGKGIADLLVTKLVQSGVYTVVERKQIEKILAEQNFGASGRVDATTAAKIGKILGVDTLIMGSINTFGRDDSSKSKAGGGAVRIPGNLPGFGGMKVNREKAKAVVGVNFRMVNTTTAEIFYAGDARGESKRESTSVSGGGGIIGDVVGAGNQDMTSSNFASTIIGEAVYDAVGKLSSQLESKAATLPVLEMKVEGTIADVAGSMVVLNVGKNAGLKVGDKLNVERPIKEVKDPDTGKVLRVLSDKIGEVVITEVDDVSAVGKYTGSQPAKVKDKVKK